MVERGLKVIHPNGYWLDESEEGHIHDPYLATALIELFPGKYVVDLGCGLGKYVKAFRDAKIEADGYDGNPNTPALTKGACGVLDLALCDCDVGDYDWVLSLEVGEHIPSQYQNNYINKLIDNAKDGVVVSWAIPGQGGRGHVNCRENIWVIKEFTDKGFYFDFARTIALRSRSTVDYYKNTILVFRRQCPRPKIYVGMPLYTRQVDMDAAVAYLEKPSRKIDFDVIGSYKNRSLLPYCFNELYADAINNMLHGVTHFAMQHGDAVPQVYWLDILYQEQVRLKADMVAAVIPLKDRSGRTSTAIDNPENLWAPRRLTMEEVYNLPETFSIEDIQTAGMGDPGGGLLLNTGCFICHLLKPWAMKINPANGYLQCMFMFRDAIIKNRENKWQAAVASEDWNYSRWLNFENAKLFATRKVKVNHWGDESFTNDHPWGNVATDYHPLERNCDG
jgi:hypothetical protein